MSKVVVNKDGIVQKIWNLCNVLRGDGISYRDYISELTYLLFLKIAEETKTENLLPKGYRWKDLVNYPEADLLGQYQEMLTHLGAKAKNKLVREIYAFPTTVFSHSENLRVVVNEINKIEWHSLSRDSIGEIYEGLLAKHSEDARSAAGQYFTPRSLVDSIVRIIQPQFGEIIQDPATGTGGFLISADHYIKSLKTTKRKPPTYQGIEIERGTYRLCLMNTFLHGMNAEIWLGDALTTDAHVLNKANLILANPPFGSKSGSVREVRKDISFSTTNKQLAFLQHIYTSLKPNGRAAVVLPDNVLFEGNAGKKIRQELMDKCFLHTILRLPTGIFYSHGVKTNVLFFQRGKNDKNNTKNVWVFDMRSNMPSFGKRTPLTKDHFRDFESAYGKDPNGQSKRTDEGKAGRFRKFSRKYIREREENLDIVWLKDSGRNSNLDEPDILTTEAIAELETTIESLREVIALLGVGS